MPGSACRELTPEGATSSHGSPSENTTHRFTRRPALPRLRHPNRLPGPQFRGAIPFVAVPLCGCISASVHRCISASLHLCTSCALFIAGSHFPLSIRINHLAEKPHAPRCPGADNKNSNVLLCRCAVSLLPGPAASLVPRPCPYCIPAITSMRGSVISSMAMRTPSRPCPDSFTPP